MAITYLKKASRTAATGEADVRDAVAAMLAEIQAGGEAKAAEYSRKFDRWDGEIAVPEAEVAAARERVPQRLQDDIRFAHDRVRRFAEAQLASQQAFEVELSPGLWAGQRLVPKHLALLPEPNRGNAEAAWRDYGEVVLAETREEAARASDDYAAEHLEVQAAELDWWLGRLRNYGSLFLGEETTVAYGDKASGPNHILPTKGAGRYTGGLSVGKFIKTVTYQRMSREANRDLGAVTARISRLEGMEGHARTADLRLEKYSPGEDFVLTP